MAIDTANPWECWTRFSELVALMRNDVFAIESATRAHHSGTVSYYGMMPCHQLSLPMQPNTKGIVHSSNKCTCKHESKYRGARQAMLHCNAA
eukprot:1042866-Amphidinium_carterae.1